MSNIRGFVVAGLVIIGSALMFAGNVAAATTNLKVYQVTTTKNVWCKAVDQTSDTGYSSGSNSYFPGATTFTLFCSELPLANCLGSDMRLKAYYTSDAYPYPPAPGGPNSIYVGGLDPSDPYSSVTPFQTKLTQVAICVRPM